MARPRLEPGTWGVISVKELTPPGTPKRDQKHEASAQFRRKDGSYSRMRRIRATGPRAEGDLKAAMVEEAQKIRAEMLSRDTTVSKVIDLWLAELRAQVARNDAAANTYSQYRTNANKWVKPYIGQLGVGTELRVRHLDDVLTNARDKHGLSGETTNNIKKVLQGLCAYAVRHDAMDANLARSVAPISRKTNTAEKKAKALTLEQRRDLLAKARAECATHYQERDGKKLGRRDLIWRHIPDMIEAMLSTGQRIGELLAAAGEDVTLADDGRIAVWIRAHLVRDPDRGGLYRVPGRKNDQPDLLLGVPSWSEPMWTRLAATERPGYALFPSFRGPDTWLDDSNVQSKIKAVFKAIGYEWVTPKVFRATVSEVLREAGLSDEERATQLGNSPAVIRRHYTEHEKQVNHEQRAALERHMFGAATTEEGNGS